MTIYDILKDIITTKSGELYDDVEFEKVYNPFMITRYLSMDARFVKYINELNIYYAMNKNMSKTQHYMYLITTIPKSNNSFIKYIKKSNNSET